MKVSALWNFCSRINIRSRHIRYLNKNRSYPITVTRNDTYVVYSYDGIKLHLSAFIEGSSITFPLYQMFVTQLWDICV